MSGKFDRTRRSIKRCFSPWRVAAHLDGERSERSVMFATLRLSLEDPDDPHPGGSVLARFPVVDGEIDRQDPDFPLLRHLRVLSCDARPVPEETHLGNIVDTTAWGRLCMSEADTAPGPARRVLTLECGLSARYVLHAGAVHWDDGDDTRLTDLRLGDLLDDAQRHMLARAYLDRRP